MTTVSPRTRIIVTAAAVTAAALVYFLFDPLKAAFFPPCPFHLLTGLYCPGCGTQRALHALLHGHLLRAAGDNLLAVMALPFVGYSAVAAAGSRLGALRWSQDIFYRPWFARTVLALVLLFWILRNLPFPCFRWMAP